MRTRSMRLPLHALDDEAGAVGLDRLALVGHVAELVQHEAADRVVLLVLGQAELEALVDLVDRHDAGDERGAVGSPADLGRLDVVLVGDLADQLLEQVLEGDEAGRAAVLVDDDGEVHLLLAHLPQQLGHPLGLGHEPRRSGHGADRDRRRGRRARPARGPSGRRRRRRRRSIVPVTGKRLKPLRMATSTTSEMRKSPAHGDHVGPGHHHLADDRVAELEERLDELALLGLDHLALDGEVGDGEELLLGEERARPSGPCPGGSRW